MKMFVLLKSFRRNLILKQTNPYVYTWLIIHVNLQNICRNLQLISLNVPCVHCTYISVRTSLYLYSSTSIPYTSTLNLTHVSSINLSIYIFHLSLFHLIWNNPTALQVIRTQFSLRVFVRGL